MKKEVVQFIIFFVALVILIAALQIQVLDKPTVERDENYVKTVGAVGGGGGSGLGTGTGEEGDPPSVADEGGGDDGGGGGTPTVCGDGQYQKFIEQCDDGNTASGDGCSSSCSIEAGFACAGSPSICSTQESSSCGNSILDNEETCDDGNTASGDGCSFTCQIESGWICDGEPSECTSGDGGGQEECGDSKVQGEEQCDDDNTDDGDGCSSVCEVEYPWTCEPIDPSDPDGQSYCSCSSTECGGGQRGGNPGLDPITDLVESLTAILKGEDKESVISIFSLNDGNPLPEETTYISLNIKENDKITFVTKNNVEVVITAKKLTEDLLGLTISLPSRTEIFTLSSSSHTKFLDLDRKGLTDFAIILVKIVPMNSELRAQIKLISMEESIGSSAPKDSDPEVLSFIEEIIQNSPELSASRQISREAETQRIALIISMIGLVVVLAYIIVRHVKNHKPSRKKRR